MVAGARLVVSEPFAFAPSSSDLLDDAPVQELLCALLEDPDRTVQIEVHTDSQGSSAYNLRLSQSRADAIREAIRRLGVAEGRVTSVGYGETMPIAPNTTAEGRAANRRIELHLAPPGERPPRPPGADGPAPVPAPAPGARPKPPPPPPTLCEEIDHQFVVEEGRTWVRAAPIDRWKDEVSACLGPGWDVDVGGSELHAHRAGWTVVVAPLGDGVQIELARDGSP